MYDDKLALLETEDGPEVVVFGERYVLRLTTGAILSCTASRLDTDSNFIIFNLLDPTTPAGRLGTKKIKTISWIPR